MLRVTSNQMHRTLIDNIQNAQKKVMDSNEQISSGYRLNRPSDDPVAAAQAMNLMSLQHQYEQYESNVQQARMWSVSTENGVSQSIELVQRAKTLVMQAISDTSNTVNKKSVADEINAIADSIRMLGNTKVNNDYIFSGSMTDTPAYPTAGIDTYGGNQISIQREISPGIKTNINLNAQSVFGDDTSGLLKTLRDTAADLITNTSASMTSLRTTRMQDLDSSLDTLTSAQSQVGAVQSRLDFYETRLRELQTSNSELLSITRDVDLAQASAEYAQRQTALTAALKTGQSIVQPSLIDFIR